MVVGCPKCKVKLKVDDGKIKPEGLKIKCPKCETMLMVRRPAAAVPSATARPAAQPARPAAPAAPAAPAKPAPSAPAPTGAGLRAPEGPHPIEAQAKALNPKKILVAHENAKIVETAMMQLMERGYLVIPLPNGVDTLVQAMKELPFLVILDAALPKIDGFEIIRRLREKAETKDIKAVIVSSKTDARRQRKQPPAMYGVDAYIDDDELSGGLIPIVTAAVSGQPVPEPAAPAAPARPAAPAAPAKPAAPAAPSAMAAPAAPAKPAAPAAAPEAGGGAVDRDAEKAKRLARIVLSDIELYDPEKVAESIRLGQFETVFAEELREGLKHYQNRIPKEVRAKGNFFQESLDEFIARKKKTLGIA